MKKLMLICLMFASFLSYAAITVDSAKKSSSLNSYGRSYMTDEASRRLPIMGFVAPDANGVTGLNNTYFTAAQFSQVTGLEDLPLYTLATGFKVPLYSLVGINPSTRLPVPMSSLFLSSAGGTLTGSITVPAVSTASLTVTGMFVAPTMTASLRDSITPVPGMIIYNTDTSKHQGYNGTWNDLY